MTPPDIQLRGLLGDALDANRRGRLSHFILDETSPAIALFAPERRAGNVEGATRLVTACHCSSRST